MSQRQLARALGLSVGKTHYALKAVLDRGWVKAQNFRRSDNRSAYLYKLTPNGLQEKARPRTTHRSTHTNTKNKMKVLITGSAGFIGSALSLRLLERGDQVVGVDNLNDYYDVSLKEARLARTQDHPNFTEVREDIADRAAMERVFREHRPERVVNLAAQAGVRYSLENPAAYVDTNLVGFGNILEGCRHNGVEHLVYASSSSVYGANTTMPFSVHDNVDHPLSLYAASKKANELMAHT